MTVGALTVSVVDGAARAWVVALRNALLPELISRELREKDTERIIEIAV